jgi:putative transposase
MQMKVKSKASKTQQGKGCTMSNCTSEGMDLELPLFAIAELVPQNNEMTWIGKLLTCNPSIQEQR